MIKLTIGEGREKPSPQDLFYKVLKRVRIKYKDIRARAPVHWVSGTTDLAEAKREALRGYFIKQAEKQGHWVTSWTWLESSPDILVPLLKAALRRPPTIVLYRIIDPHTKKTWYSVSEPQITYSAPPTRYFPGAPQAVPKTWDWIR